MPTPVDAIGVGTHRHAELERIADEIRMHRGCGMEACESCGHPVPGEGSATASLVLLGEAPGAREDATGRPFVGASGKILTRLLGSIGMEREDVFITNVMKARPPANRDPRPDEIAHALPWLEAQLNLIQPQFVVLLGRHALSIFFQGQTISSARGQAIKADGRTYVPVFHPAAGLRSTVRMRALEEDFARLGQLVRG